LEYTEGRSHVLLTGDFNHPEINWQQGGTTPQDPNHKATKFVEALRDAFLVQHVTKPTHYRANQTPNTLDLLITNEEGMLEGLEHKSPLGKSHHQLLQFDFKCYTAQPPSPPRNQYVYHKGDYDRLRNIMDSYEWDLELDHLEAAAAWDHLESILQKALKETVPMRKKHDNTYRRKPIWMNQTAIRKIKKKRHAYQRYLQTKEGSDYSAYAQARNQAKWACRKAVRDFERKLAQEAKTNPKAFYAYARSKLKTKEGIADLEDGDGGVATSDAEKAEVLNTFFSSVFTKEDVDNIPTFEPRSEVKLENFNITATEVRKKLQKLKPNKSPGPDGHHPRVLRELAHHLAYPLSIVFQKSLNEGVVPQKWKDAHVTAIYKKGGKSVPGNYRPVSLTSIICKIMESLVRDCIIKHMTQQNLLTPNQHGFLHGRSCATNLLATLDAWTTALDNGQPVDAIYLDFAKAFDTVPHQRLITKMNGYGITGNVLKWTEEFLTDRRQRVNIKGSLSQWVPVTSGIPQGSVLGPCLFVIFINDLPDVIHSMSQMFADDTKVFREINNDEDKDTLQQDLHKLSNWSDLWQLRFNEGKCKVLHMGKNNPNHSYVMGSRSNPTLLGETTLEKDLGINIDPELKFSKHIETQVNKANKLLGMIRRTFEYLDAPTVKKLFTSLVRPHLEFMNIAWTPQLVRDQDLLEQVQRRATRLIPGFKEYDYEQRLRLLNLPSLAFRRLRGDMIDTYKFTHGIYTSQPILQAAPESSITRGHKFKLLKVRSKTKIRANFYSNRITESWNNLSDHIVNAPSVNAFKNRLDAAWSEHMYDARAHHPIKPLITARCETKPDTKDRTTERSLT
jgi:hypothetical protein